MSQQRCLDNENTFYHVYNRGVNKQNIFLEDFDRYYFLKLCRKAKEKFNIEFHAFCLMDNHYHLLVHTLDANLSKAMKYMGERYAKYFIQKYQKFKKSGHTFMGRYGRKIINNDKYMKTIISYIHLNPVKDNFCAHPEIYKWSSYNSYYENYDYFNLINLDILKNFYSSYLSNDVTKVKNDLLEIKFEEIYSKKIINSSIMKAHLKEYNIDEKIYRKLYTYCILEWTELDSYDLSKEFMTSANSIRKLKSSIKFEIEDNNTLLQNLIYSVRKNLELF